MLYVRDVSKIILLIISINVIKEIDNSNKKVGEPLGLSWQGYIPGKGPDGSYIR